MPHPLVRVMTLCSVAFVPAPSQLPCCTGDGHPEPSRAHRCHQRGLRDECGPAHRQFCPIGCGHCRLCASHPLYSQLQPEYERVRAAAEPPPPPNPPSPPRPPPPACSSPMRMWAPFVRTSCHAGSGGVQLETTYTMIGGRATQPCPIFDCLAACESREDCVAAAVSRTAFGLLYRQCILIGMPFDLARCVADADADLYIRPNEATGRSAPVAPIRASHLPNVAMAAASPSPPSPPIPPPLISHDLAAPHDDSSGLAAFISAIAQRAHILRREALPRAPPGLAGAPTVAYTFTNYAYVSGFANWLHAARASLATPAVAATDMASYRWFRARGVDCLLLLDGAHKPLNERFLYIRAEVTSRLLHAGLKVIFSEQDIFWTAPPPLLESPTADLQVSEQGFGKGDLNVGFYMARPTAAAKALFAALARWTTHPSYSYCWDQALFDYAVRRDPTLLLRECLGSRPGGFSLAKASRALLVEEARPLRWERIPYELLPHPYKVGNGVQRHPQTTDAYLYQLPTYVLVCLFSLPPPQLTSPLVNRNRQDLFLPFS